MASINDDNFICYETPGSLQNFATVTIAAHLWRLEINQTYATSGSIVNAHPDYKSIIQYQLPKSIENIIEACVECVKAELYKWTENYYLSVGDYYDTHGVFLHEYFDTISWQSSYQINYNQTAKNLLACPNLDFISKYNLACLYCFEDDIKNIWPHVQLDENLREYTKNRTDLYAYWYRRMEKEFPNLHCSLSLQEEDEMDVLENHVLGSVTISSTVLYLWKRLKPETQVELFVSMMEEEICTPITIKFLLPSFTKMQLETVFERCGTDIICTLVRGLHENDADYTLRIWSHVRNVIPGWDFFSLLMEISDQTRPIFYDIWSLAPDHLKNYVAKCNDLYYLLRILYKGAFVTEPNIVEIIKYLIYRADSKILKSFWINNWHVLIEVLNLDDVDEFMKLCFKNDKDIAEYKRTHLAVYSLKIAAKCFNLIHQERFDELMAFLNFSSPDINVVEDLKRKIVQSWKSFEYLLANADNPGKIRSFVNFAEDVRFSNDDGEIGLNLFNSFLNSEFINQAFIYDRFDCVKKLVCVLISEIDTNNMKAKLVENFHSVLTNGKFLGFDVKNWNEFLLWCFDDDQHKLIWFKLSLPIDDIFFRILFENSFSNSAMEDAWSVLGSYSDNDELMNNRYSYNLGGIDRNFVHDILNNLYRTLVNSNGRNERILHSDDDYSTDSSDEMNTRDDSGSKDAFCVSVDLLHRINTLLFWYIPCRQGVAEFKMKKLEERDVSLLRDLFASSDENSIRIVLDWFFDGDIERIKLFKSSLRDSS